LTRRRGQWGATKRGRELVEHKAVYFYFQSLTMKKSPSSALAKGKRPVTAERMSVGKIHREAKRRKNNERLGDSRSTFAHFCKRKRGVQRFLYATVQLGASNSRTKQG